MYPLRNRVSGNKRAATSKSDGAAANKKTQEKEPIREESYDVQKETEAPSSSKVKVLLKTLRLLYKVSLVY